MKLNFKNKEDSIQSSMYIWFNNNYPKYRGLLFSVPNGGGRSSFEGKILKLTGLFSGVSDLIFLWKGAAYFIEVKTMHGTQSDRQIKWQALVEANGFKYFLVRRQEEFEALIISIMNGNGYKG